MIRIRLPLALAVIAATTFFTPGLAGKDAATEALFGLDSPAAGPFPSDWFTVPDPANATHRRVSLPMPDCQQHASDCEDTAVLNELDGFNQQPRLSVPFSGPIDPASVTSDTLFLVSLGSTGPGEAMPWGTVVAIDQVVWDSLTNTLYVESDALLAEHTRFALIVTAGIRDEQGTRVQASDAFRHFRAIVRDDYKQALLDAVHAARHVGLREEDVAAASVFTTRSATAVLEKIRDQIHAETPDPADFVLGTAGERTVFSLTAVTGITWNRQTRIAGPLIPTPINLAPIRGTFPGAVGTLAFGRYRSPDYQVHPGEYIPQVGTRAGRPEVQEITDVYFNLLLPSGARPAGGWPVVIFGHGVNGNKNIPPLNVAASMARHGLATIAINAVGHGFGPLGTLSVSQASGMPVTLAAGGRGRDQDGDATIGDAEGVAAGAPRSLLFLSDAYRQTAVDLMQLARIIEVGVDVDGDGQSDLDATRIYYLASSLGAGYGTVFLAVEPDVRAGVLSVPADPPALTWSLLRRSVAGAMLEARQPSLLNAPGVMAIAERPVSPPFFDENMPLRERTPLEVQLSDLSTRVIQSPVVNDVPGAMAIQEAFDRIQWASGAGSPVAYAAHLRKAPLAGMAAKTVLYQIAMGDESAPNPTTTAILRAGDLADRTLYYRHDLAWLARATFPFPTLPKNPHGFAVGLANFGAIALGAQHQAGVFFASDGTIAIRPEPAQFFEFPIVGPLPEGLNYIK